MQESNNASVPELVPMPYLVPVYFANLSSKIDTSFLKIKSPFLTQFQKASSNSFLCFWAKRIYELRIKFILYCIVIEIPNYNGQITCHLQRFAWHCWQVICSLYF